MAASHVERRERLVLSFAMVFPALMTWVYFDLLADQSEAAQQFAYLLEKFVQLALPVVWVGLVAREKVRWKAPRGNGLALGAGFGLAIVGAMVAIYFVGLKPQGVFAAESLKIRDKLVGIGITTPAAFLMMGVLYSTVHSLFEEYYWRWFVYGRLRNVVPASTAIAISSVAFMAHHVVVLGGYFGWDSIWTYFFSGATAVGGAYWAWLYQRSGSIYGPWLSHLLIDAGIFGIGYDLVRSVSAV